MSARRELHLNAFLMEAGHHEAAWRRPARRLRLGALDQAGPAGEILSRLGGGRGHFTFVGTPEQAADTIIAWFEGGAADGFNIMAPALPSALETFIDQVLPILRSKGLFREEYRGTTLREHYGVAVPANQFHGNWPPPACRADIAMNLAGQGTRSRRPDSC